jgi:glycerol-3-phosphate dehydrogenase (NAD(P)+)
MEAGDRIRYLKSGKVGVIGAGSFGTAIANLLALNSEVILYSRNTQRLNSINTAHSYGDFNYHPRIHATDDPAFLCASCNLIFPIVPSGSFRSMMRTFAAYLRPSHLLIHGTKGFDIWPYTEAELTYAHLNRGSIRTMSQVILEESDVLRVGCLSGPNLSKEIMQGQPTATVIASEFQEVAMAGKAVLNSQGFHVFASSDRLGAELAGALKNTIALASGILSGRGLGKNIQAMLITRGLHEMIHIGRVMGSDSQAFVGMAGIGDLLATATSEQSRNFTFGMRLAGGESFETVKGSMPELAEGVRTLRIVQQLSKSYKLHIPINDMLYRVVFEGFDIDRAIHLLVRYPYDIDVDFM